MHADGMPSRAPAYPFAQHVRRGAWRRRHIALLVPAVKLLERLAAAACMGAPSFLAIRGLLVLPNEVVEGV